MRRFNTAEKILVAFLGAVACGGAILVCTFILVLVLTSTFTTTFFEHVVSMSLDRAVEISLMAGGAGFLAGAAFVLIRQWEDEKGISQQAPAQRLKP